MIEMRENPLPGAAGKGSGRGVARGDGFGSEDGAGGGGP